MTREEIMNLDFDGIETRINEIEVETDSADKTMIESLNAELDIIEERKKILIDEAEEKRKLAEAIARGVGETVEVMEEDKMTNKEVRATDEYLNAYAKYIKTGKDAECRALLTEAVEGVVPVPAFVDDIIETAWESDEIFSRVSKTYLPGNDRVAFEASATGAEFHTEGDDEPDEEELILGVVDLIPDYMKKWVTASDKAIACGPRQLTEYLYDEIEYQIVKAVADAVVQVIGSAPETSTSSAVGVPRVEAVVDPASIIDGLALLGSNARNRVFIASGQTIADVKKAALLANYQFDPFQQMTVIQNDTVTKGAIIGDLRGVRANLPEGGAVKFIFDELSLAEKDLIKIVGKMLVAIAVVTPKMFAIITGEEASE